MALRKSWLVLALPSLSMEILPTPQTANSTAPTGGVTSPSGPQTYGAVAAGGGALMALAVSPVFGLFL